MPPVVIAVDGPSGSGKSSVSKAVAQRFGFDYLDTGAMYRAVTWWALAQGLDESEVPGRLAQCVIVSGTDPQYPHISVNGTDVSAEIRTPEVTAAVSRFSAVPEVRVAMVAQQQEVARSVTSGLVAEGRDLGTVVFPDARLKVFLTADVAARAQRRAAEDAGRGHGGDESATHHSLTERDRADSQRAMSPLRISGDAVEVDATHLSLAEVVDSVVALVQERL